MISKKQRLDVVLVNRGLAESRQRALAYVMSGSVWVNGCQITKAGTKILPDSSVQIKGQHAPYVSRGGIKLEAAIKGFQLDVRGFRCLDVGASTGGFTDCLLQHGANHVIAVDVGYGQMHWKIRSDPRVTVMERTNIRHLDPASVPFPIDLICIDVSFISLGIVVPAVLPFLKTDGHLVCLVKPQFEVGKGMVGKGGVVRDPLLHQKIIDDLVMAFEKHGLEKRECIPSPILGPKGNQEYLVLLTPFSSTANIFSHPPVLNGP